MNNDSTKIYDNLKDLEQAAKETISRIYYRNWIKHNSNGRWNLFHPFPKVG